VRYTRHRTRGGACAHRTEISFRIVRVHTFYAPSRICWPSDVFRATFAAVSFRFDRLLYEIDGCKSNVSPIPAGVPRGLPPFVFAFCPVYFNGVKRIIPNRNIL